MERERTVRRTTIRGDGPGRHLKDTGAQLGLKSRLVEDSAHESDEAFPFLGMETRPDALMLDTGRRIREQEGVTATDQRHTNRRLTVCSVQMIQVVRPRDLAH